MQKDLGWESWLDSGLVTLGTCWSWKTALWSEAAAVHCSPDADTKDAKVICEGHLFPSFTTVTTYLQRILNQGDLMGKGH